MIQCAMLLGGKGTRLGLRDRPKPMVEVAGMPLLRRSVDVLAAQGVRRFVFLVDHMADVIREAFGDGSGDGLEIRYAWDDGGLGTAGATRAAAELLEEEFLVVYGDLLFDVDVTRFCAAARRTDGHGTLMLHPNDHPTDSDLVSIAPGTGRTDPITAIHGKPRPEGALHRNRVNAGAYHLRKAALRDIDPGMRSPDWARDVLPAAVARGVRYHGYRTIEYIKDVGTPDRIARGRRDAALGRVHRRSYRTRQPAVFLDRDGVINREIGDVLDPSDVVLLPHADDAIARLNAAGIAAILVADQVGGEKGVMAQARLEHIHARLDDLLGRRGAYLDDIYCCIRCPQAGRPGAAPELKGKGDSAKAGLLRRAGQEHALSLERSIMIGDRDVDMEAGRSVGCLTIHVPTNMSAADAAPVVAADREAPGLEAAVEIALSELG